MLRLPNELFPSIASELDLERDINALARTNRRLFSCLDYFLYCHNTLWYNSSALKWAAAHGREETAQKALNSGASCIADALGISAENGQEGVARMLLGVYSSHRDLKTRNDDMIFSRAVSKGHLPIIGLLLESGKFEVDCRYLEGRSPLSQAAQGGHAEIVQMLLDSGKVEADSRDQHGRSPLSYAASSGSAPAVMALLNTGMVEVDSRDVCSQTPLAHAAMEGSESVIKLLLETGEVEIGSRDIYGRTPLSQARSRGYYSIMNLLLEGLEAAR